ncbi:hypothetical protein HPP92_016911 [Vanilla planifolia]|uniref:Uncharacterized protein n=1 Tax=Vanilla planifolia TaxID=51239 RepID=A0A835QL24_VANPL|nr:hypothetical protein HPP92_016911 [Vanilla planifolia]
MAASAFMSMAYLNQSNSFIDEHHWLSLIRGALEEDEAEHEGTKVKVKVSIFSSLRTWSAPSRRHTCLSCSPSAPTTTGLPHLYDMERYKISATRKIQSSLHPLKLPELINCFMKNEHRIRSYYHKHLDFEGETLAWMMAIDASFLLDFLRNFTPEAEGLWKRSSSQQTWDASRMKMAYNMVTRDVMMLENQIPLFLLRKIMQRCQKDCSNVDDKELSEMLTGFVKEVIPIKSASNVTLTDVKQYAHLLHLLYSVIVPKEIEDGFGNMQESECRIDMKDSEEDPTHPGVIKSFFDSAWSYASNVNGGATIRTIKRFVIIGPIKLIVNVPWKIITGLPGISMLKRPIESLISRGFAKKDETSTDESKSGSKPPLLEEITIPSVEELTGAGVRFLPSMGGLTTMRFEVLGKQATMYLPTVTLDVNTEVVLRNLVAYESLAESRSMVFTRYTELMNGIIDTEEDVKLLRKCGIIRNHMKSDKEVADLWNGMSRSVMLSKVPFIDKVLEDVNRYYNSQCKVKAKKFIKKYVFGSWQILTFLAALLLLLLTCVQAFCNVYSCGQRWFNLTD